MGKLAVEIKKREPFESLRQEVALQILRTADLLTRQLTDFLKVFGLSNTQYNALRILRGAGANGLPCGEVAERMVTREPDITRLLDRIERQGWIERRRQTDDRRVVKAWLSPSGAALLKKIDQPLKQFHQQQFRQLKREEQQQIITLMERARE